ncbi:MAG: DUF3300 domain-containing protein [Syntrophobacteraceae bacterium]|nr:DUF3300 domain-containing protein [Syntrophobacteraceae bacterium]
MRQKLIIAWAVIAVAAVFMVPWRAFGQQGPPPPVVATFSQEQLDQMLAPIALYPDSLLAQILLAATYPQQVMEADHWLREQEGIRGRALNEALDRMEWELSVKALAPFPQVMDMMAQEPEWTQKLGEAFLAQQIEVMDSIQRLRRRAHEAGHLRTTAEQRVVVRRECIEIRAANPQIVYVPRYNPVVVYGTWWWPAYPPFAYYPVWPGVVVSPVVGVFGFWGSVTVGPVWGWGWGSWGWRDHQVYLNINRTVNINTVNVGSFRSSFQTTGLRQAVVSGRFGAGSSTWGAARSAVARSGGAERGAHGVGAGGRFGRAYGHRGHFRAYGRSGFSGSGVRFHPRSAGFHGRGPGARRFEGAVRRAFKGGRRGGPFRGRASRAGWHRAGPSGFSGRRGSHGRNPSFRRAAGSRSYDGRKQSFRRGGRSFGGGGRSFGGGRGRSGAGFSRGAGRLSGVRSSSFGGGRGGAFGAGFKRGGGSMRTAARAGGGGPKGGRRR